VATLELKRLYCLGTEDLFCRDDVALSVWVDGARRDVLRHTLEEGYGQRLGRRYAFRSSVRIDIVRGGAARESVPDPDRFELVDAALAGLPAGTYALTARFRSHGSTYRCELELRVGAGEARPSSGHPDARVAAHKLCALARGVF